MRSSKCGGMSPHPPDFSQGQLPRSSLISLDNASWFQGVLSRHLICSAPIESMYYIGVLVEYGICHKGLWSISHIEDTHEIS